MPFFFFFNSSSLSVWRQSLEAGPCHHQAFFLFLQSPVASAGTSLFSMNGPECRRNSEHRYQAAGGGRSGGGPKAGRPFDVHWLWPITRLKRVSFRNNAGIVELGRKAEKQWKGVDESGRQRPMCLGCAATFSTSHLSGASSTCLNPECMQPPTATDVHRLPVRLPFPFFSPFSHSRGWS